MNKSTKEGKILQNKTTKTLQNELNFNLKTKTKNINQEYRPNAFKMFHI